MAMERSPPDRVSLCSLPLKGPLSSDAAEGESFFLVKEGESLRQKKSRCVINKVG